MKKWIVLLTIAVLSFGGCGRGDEAGKNDGSAPNSGSEAEGIEGTVFRYEGREYDLSERNSGINNITEYASPGEYIIVEGHTGPGNGIYSFFNTLTGEFEKDIEGANLIFYDNDINTAAYTFWNEVYAYDGTRLASYKLDEGEYIRNLSYNEDHTKIAVEIWTAEGESRMEEIRL